MLQWSKFLLFSQRHKPHSFIFVEVFYRISQCCASHCRCIGFEVVHHQRPVFLPNLAEHPAAHFLNQVVLVVLESVDKLESDFGFPCPDMGKRSDNRNARLPQVATFGKTHQNLMVTVDGVFADNLRCREVNEVPVVDAVRS